MDLADASVVVMSELHTRAPVLTVDGRDVIDSVAPPRRRR
jgi:hypothetical protein